MYSRFFVAKAPLNDNLEKYESIGKMKICKYIVLLAMLFSLGACQRSQEERNGILKVYNWADYIDEDVLAEFPEWYKEQTGEDIEIIYQVFDINVFIYGGGVTKLVDVPNARIVRLPNPKYPHDYLTMTEKIMEQKKEIVEFYK